MQHMRIPGSGTASPRDIDLAWEELQASALRDLVLKENSRPDGRGLLDLRPLDCEVIPECLPTKKDEEMLTMRTENDKAPPCQQYARC